MIRIYRASVKTLDTLQDVAIIEIADNGIVAEITAPLDYLTEYVEATSGLNYRKETDENGFDHWYKDYDIDDIMEAMEEGYILEFVDYLNEKLK